MSCHLHGHIPRHANPLGMRNVLVDFPGLEGAQVAKVQGTSQLAAAEHEQRVFVPEKGRA